MDIRERLLEAALPHVPFDGWTETALMRAATDLGLSRDEARRAFPGGPAEMVEAFSLMADRRMVEELEARDSAALRTTERVRAAVRIRLQQAEPWRESVQRALAFLALPRNAPLAAKLLWRTVDTIWRAAGDTATDWNHYSRRGLLAGVFSATVLYWLTDRSEGRADTWDFLDRRLADLASFGKATSKIRDRLSSTARRYRPYRARR